MPQARADAADAVAQVDAVIAFRTLHRPIENGEHHGVALAEPHDLAAALHARPLLGQHELAAGEILARLRQQDGDLDRESEDAVEILMQAYEISGDVLQEQRRRPRLPGLVAAVEERRMVVRI